MSIGYNAIGCPTTYDGYTATWTRGKLAKLNKRLLGAGTYTYNFSYDAFGRRISKKYSYATASGIGATTVLKGDPIGSTKVYHYDESGRLIFEYISNQYYQESDGRENLVYLYDADMIIGVVYTNESNVTNTYYFERNLLGDVIAIYDTSGSRVGAYAYDAWGNCKITQNLQRITTLNPIRYRGYYYDQDTKLYYLNARYYCPEWRRFISPDDTSYLDPESVNGLNLYTYCGNDPINKYDPSGHFAITLTTLLIGGLIAGGIGAGIGFGVAYIPDVIENVKKDGFQWNDLNTFSENWDHYIGTTLGGFVAGFGVGICTVLGAGVGAAALGETTATLFTSTGLTLSLGSALGIGSGVAFATGIAGYTIRTGISGSEDFKVQNMFIEGGFNAISGALSVLGGYLGGMAGVHNTVFTKLLSQKGDLLLRLLVENVFIAGFKLTNALVKPYFMI